MCAHSSRATLPEPERRQKKNQAYVQVDGSVQRQLIEKLPYANLAKWHIRMLMKAFGSCNIIMHMLRHKHTHKYVRNDRVPYTNCRRTLIEPGHVHSRTRHIYDSDRRYDNNNNNYNYRKKILKIFMNMKKKLNCSAYETNQKVARKLEQINRAKMWAWLEPFAIIVQDVFECNAIPWIWHNIGSHCRLLI